MSVNPARATGNDVARLAGVDRSTVSRILGRAFDQHRYAPDTIRAVERAAHKLNYRPSMAARSLRTGRSMTVGLIVGDISNSFFGDMAAEIEPLLRSHRYRLMIGSMSEDPKLQVSHLEDMLHYGVDGIIISPACADGLNDAVIRKTPVVLIDRPLSRQRLPYVGLDNHNAGRILGEHLCRLGYRRIGVVLPDVANDPTISWRLQGLKAGLARAAQIVWRQTVPVRVEESSRHAIANRFLSETISVQAIVGLTNDCTMSALEATRELGLSVPDRIGLAGIDDFRAAKWVDPPLTVVAQPIKAIAREAVNYLMSALAGQPSKCDCLLCPELKVRQSLRLIDTYQENP
jgi:DNA-binding LacI/PurR family transcriptional regulator